MRGLLTLQHLKLNSAPPISMPFTLRFKMILLWICALGCLKIFHTQTPLASSER